MPVRILVKGQRHPIHISKATHLSCLFFQFIVLTSTYSLFDSHFNHFLGTASVILHCIARCQLCAPRLVRSCFKGFILLWWAWVSSVLAVEHRVVRARGWCVCLFHSSQQCLKLKFDTICGSFLCELQAKWQKVTGKLKYLLFKITHEWKLQDLQEFGEQYNSQINMVKLLKKYYQYKYTDMYSHTV